MIDFYFAVAIKETKMMSLLCVLVKIFLFIFLLHHFLLVCEDPLGTENHELPDYALLATAPHYDAKGIRLHKSDPFLLEPQVDEYVQVDLGTGGKTVTAVTIEGRFTSSNKDWITKFVLNYSRDGCEFSSYMENGAVKVGYMIRN